MIALAVGITLYLIGSGLDVYTTKRAVIDNPARFREGNEVMLLIVSRWGWFGLAIVKLIVLGGVLGVGYAVGDVAATGWPLAGAGGIFGFVAWRNRKLVSERR